MSSTSNSKLSEKSGVKSSGASCMNGEGREVGSKEDVTDVTSSSTGAAAVDGGNPTSSSSSSNITDGRRYISVTGPGSRYVKLNVGGSLHYTTIATLTKQDTMLRAMFSGRMEVLTDSEGWILVDRCGKHFPTILNYLRDGNVGLPDTRREVFELQSEAKYFLIQGLIDLCQRWIDASDREKEDNLVCKIPIISTNKDVEKFIHNANKPVIKLLLNRHNNKYSYTNQSDDNLLRNLELFDKLVLRFSERVLFIKDVGAANEVCSWTFYGPFHTKKLAEVCCTSIVYATDKKHTKVEFPEARIYEEAMNVLLHEPLCPSCQASTAEPSNKSNNDVHHDQEDEEDRAAHEKIVKARAGIRASQS